MIAAADGVAEHVVEMWSSEREKLSRHPNRLSHAASLQLEDADTASGVAPPFRRVFETDQIAMVGISPLFPRAVGPDGTLEALSVVA